MECPPPDIAEDASDMAGLPLHRWPVRVAASAGADLRAAPTSRRRASDPAVSLP
jgi:hypothetical protein